MCCMTVTDAKTDLRDYCKTPARSAVEAWTGSRSTTSAVRSWLPARTCSGCQAPAAGELGYSGILGRPCPASRPGMNLTLTGLCSPSRMSHAVHHRPAYRRAWRTPTSRSASSRSTPSGTCLWPADTNEVTLHQILVHMTVETGRHAGHADIIRELIDERVGLTARNSNLPQRDQAREQLPSGPPHDHHRRPPVPGGPVGRADPVLSAARGE